MLKFYSLTGWTDLKFQSSSHDSKLPKWCPTQVQSWDSNIAQHFLLHPGAVIILGALDLGGENPDSLIPIYTLPLPND